MARRLPVVYSAQTRIDCQPYRCELAASSCAARHRKAHETMALVEMRKGLHLRGPDLRGCFNCPVGAYVARRVSELASSSSGQTTRRPRRWVKPVRP